MRLWRGSQQEEKYKMKRVYIISCLILVLVLCNIATDQEISKPEEEPYAYRLDQSHQALNNKKRKIKMHVVPYT